MTFVILEPEVPGGFGERAELDTSVHPPVVHRLHIELVGWLGDDLLENHPCFMVTERLAARLRDAPLTGAHLDTMEMTISPDALLDDELGELPEFRWLRVTGVAGRDDWGPLPDARLVVSATALALLEDFTLEHCDRKPLTPVDRPT